MHIALRVNRKPSAFHRILAGALLMAAVSGCSSHPHPPRPTFSPNGEPLVPPQWPQSCEDALERWFARIDANHDGNLTLAELEADAQRQYQIMDLRHDGKVTAEELSTYRLHTMGGHYMSLSTPEQKSRSDRRNPDDDGPSDAGGAYPNNRAFPDREGRSRDGENRKPVDAFGALTTDQPDPVMTADTDLDGSVTWDEFRTLVAQNFADMDHDHAGRITLSEIQAQCDRNR